MQGLPSSPQKLAFRKFVDTIKNSKTFANNRVVKTWLTWDGIKSVQAITPDMMPVVRITMLAGNIERLSIINDTGTEDGIPTVDIRTMPTIIVETFVRGSNFDDACDLYNAIDDALFPSDPSQRRALIESFRGLGVSDYWPIREILPEMTGSYDNNSICSVGSYQLVFDLTQ